LAERDGCPLSGVKYRADPNVQDVALPRSVDRIKTAR